MDGMSKFLMFIAAMFLIIGATIAYEKNIEANCVADISKNTNRSILEIKEMCK